MTDEMNGDTVSPPRPHFLNRDKPAGPADQSRRLLRTVGWLMLGWGVLVLDAVRNL